MHKQCPAVSHGNGQQANRSCGNQRSSLLNSILRLPALANRQIKWGADPPPFSPLVLRRPLTNLRENVLAFGRPGSVHAPMANWDQFCLATGVVDERGRPPRLHDLRIVLLSRPWSACISLVQGCFCSCPSDVDDRWMILRPYILCSVGNLLRLISHTEVLQNEIIATLHHIPRPEAF